MSEYYALPGESINVRSFRYRVAQPAQAIAAEMIGQDEYKVGLVRHQESLPKSLDQTGFQDRSGHRGCQAGRTIAWYVQATGPVSASSSLA